MKKLLLMVLSVAVIQSVRAQDFRMGAKGAFNSTWLFNSNISDKGDIIDYRATFGANFGLQFLLYFTENVGVSMDLLYASNEQRIEGFSENPVLVWYAEEQLKYLDVPILFHLSSEGGPYVEIGPQVGFLIGAKELLRWNNQQHPIPVETTSDYKDDFSTISLAAVLGFGYDIEVSDNWFVNVGLRFGFGLSDVTKEIAQPDIADPDDVSTASYYANKGFYNYAHSKLAGHANWSALNTHEYHATNRAFGGMQVGLIYKFD